MKETETDCGCIVVTYEEESGLKPTIVYCRMHREGARLYRSAAEIFEPKRPGGGRLARFFKKRLMARMAAKKGQAGST